MSKYTKYLKYLIRHKYFILIECFKIGLYRQGIKHDLSKFLPSEFFSYVDYFYKLNLNLKITEKEKQRFLLASLKHKNRNSHHWEYWVLNKLGKETVFEMPKNICLEMICDWYAAGRAQDKPGGWEETKSWYKENKEKMKLHENTRKFVENYLGV